MASTVRDDTGGSVIGFVVVFVSFVFRGFIPAPSWVWLVVLAVGVLLAVKDGISGLDVVTLGLAGFMIVGTLMSVANTATTDAPDLKLKEPIPVPGRVRLQAG
jgi:membrane-bound ClpP family serine protease